MKTARYIARVDGLLLPLWATASFAETQWSYIGDDGLYVALNNVSKAQLAASDIAVRVLLAADKCFGVTT